MSVQYRVVVAKGDERIDGRDDADALVTVPLAAAVAEDFEPTVAFMRGTLKATGSTGALFAAFQDGSAAAAIARLVA